VPCRVASLKPLLTVDSLAPAAVLDVRTAMRTSAIAGNTKPCTPDGGAPPPFLVTMRQTSSSLGRSGSGPADGPVAPTPAAGREVEPSSRHRESDTVSSAHPWPLTLPTGVHRPLALLGRHPSAFGAFCGESRRTKRKRSPCIIRTRVVFIASIGPMSGERITCCEYWRFRQFGEWWLGTAIAYRQAVLSILRQNCRGFGNTGAGRKL
jgi:hypothetical protein